MKKDWMVRESELDEYEIKLLTSILDKSCVVTGCAGSGKSVIALLMAKRIQKECGDNYEIIDYTKSLRKYMALGSSELGLTKGIYYHWQWKKQCHCPTADYVIVDEIRDFTGDEIAEFVKAANKHVFFFGDTAQSIFEDFRPVVPISDIDKFLLPECPKKVNLLYNYCLPVRVARFVQNVGIDLPDFEEGVFKSKENAAPFVLEYESVQDQVEAIVRIINRNDLDDVAVLLPDGQSVKLVRSFLTKMGVKHEFKYEDRETGAWYDTLDFNTPNPKLMTYHSAKGLRFVSVFLPCVRNFIGLKTGDRKALYVAMTRTYRDLYVMYSGSMPDVLSRIPTSQYKTVEPGKESIEDI